MTGEEKQAMLDGLENDVNCASELGCAVVLSVKQARQILAALQGPSSGEGEEYVGRYTCRSCSSPTDNDSDVCDACEEDAADPTPAAATGGDREEHLSEALFALSAKLKDAGFLADAANHAAYERVVKAFNMPLAQSANCLSAVVEERYLVWSNEHRAWWAPEERGYTRSVDRAGRYSRERAISIAGVRGGGWPTEGNPYEIAILERDAIAQDHRNRETTRGG